jgi:hypothetical protein
MSLSYKLNMNSIEFGYPPVVAGLILRGDEEFLPLQLISDSESGWSFVSHQ